MDTSYRRAIYQIGAAWLKSHLDKFRQFAGNYADFEKLIYQVIEREDFLPEEVFIPVRVYNQYKRNKAETQSYFVAGAWDALNSSDTAEGINKPSI